MFRPSKKIPAHKITAACLIGSAFVISACNNGNGYNPGYFTGLPITSDLSGGGSGGGTTGGGVTAIALKTIKPAFAVRGLNCMACHGVIGSNVVTDFGYGSPNFNGMFGGSRTAFNDIEGGWQLAQISGSLHVPKVTFSSSDANNYFGMNAPTSFASMLSTPNLGGNSAAMSVGITPASGQSAIIEDSVISIKYPSYSELVNLLPSNLRNQAAAVSLVQLPGVAKVSQTGLALDSSGKFVKNTQSMVTCYGDVAVKGPLFLNNVNLVTDNNGCRLYVAGTVFIQGPIFHANGNASNLQITSSRAIIMGFSNFQMGAGPGNGSSQVRTDGSSPGPVTAGGPYPRFMTSLDSQYNPSGAAINGSPSSDFFDNIVSDGLLIGSALVDAGEPAAFNNLIPGESIVTETSAGDEQGAYGGKRVAINYSGILFNAPHIHSRYGGKFSGVMIGDVVMLARNPDNVNAIEQYSYDSRFDGVPAILPALTTTILDIQH